MGFNARDAAALNAVADMFDPKVWNDALDRNFPVFRLTIGTAGSAAAISTGRAAELLYAAIDAANRFEQNVTVWIEVTVRGMPLFVAEALDRLAGYGAGIVVTQTSPTGILCSHPPGGRLPQEFLERLAKASRSGDVWHPHAQEPVEGLDI